MIQNTDPERFKPLEIELANDCAKGCDLYPKTLDAAAELLENYTFPISLSNNTNVIDYSDYCLGTSFHSKSSTSHILNPNWILLDTCSTAHVFSNPTFLKNIHTVSPPNQCEMISNTLLLDSKGFCPLVGQTAWYNPKSIGNIISLHLIAKQHKSDYEDISNESYRRPSQRWKEFDFRSLRAGTLLL